MAVPVKFDKETNLLWRLPMPGPAGSSPVVWEDKVFVTSAEGENLVLLCVGTDGKQQWKQKLEGKDKRGRMDNSNSASPSPCTDGEHVWCMIGNGNVYCFSVDGTLAWKKSLQDAYGKFNIQFGMSTTPILDNGKLYFALMHGEMRDSKATSKGQVIALDAKTGDEVWMHTRETDGVAENTHSYASPTIYRDNEREFLVTHGADYVIGHSLEDGSELWRCGGFNPKGPEYNKYLRFVSSPSCADGLIVVPTAKRRSVVGLRVDLKGNVTNDDSNFHWKREKGTPDVSTPLIYKDLVFLAGEKGTLSCLDAKTGEQKYRERLMADRQRATPVAAGDHVYIASRDGTIFVIKASDTLEVVSENKLGEELTASPAISNGTVFIRTFDALYAFGDSTNQISKKNSDVAAANEPKGNVRYSIVIHGGAGSSAKGVPQARVDQRLASLQTALAKGTSILESGGSSLDAVESVIQILEDDAQFNAGKGAVFNAAGSHELDASIMSGKDKSCGAVAGVSTVKNPIKLARLVMTETRHVLLAGQGAEEFAIQQKVELVEPTYFDTPRGKRSWERYKLRKSGTGLFSIERPGASKKQVATVTPFEPHWNIGTVGCVALDSEGNIAAGTSTGGMTNKKFGRVGDSPIVGAGTYADNTTCGVSATGIGEQYIRNAVAYDISAQMKYKNVSLQSAIEDNLNNRLDKNDGGLIAVDRDGNIAMGFNTSGMARAAADSNGRYEVLWGEHKLLERSEGSED
jgi:isoaspartyl peptidase/L-asparaginase-like protein (Ntn-hydrolase superfamily)